MQVRQKRAVFAWVPAEYVQRTADGTGLGSVYRRAVRPRCRVAFIESEHGADFVVDFEFTKIRRLFWPIHCPACAADEIAFVIAIPASRSKLNEQQPAERSSNERDRKL